MINKEHGVSGSSASESLSLMREVTGERANLFKLRGRSQEQLETTVVCRKASLGWQKVGKT